MLINPVTENIYYLLWKQDIPKQNWAEYLRSWTRCEDLRRAHELLLGAKLQNNEQTNLCRTTDTQPDDLQYRRLVHNDQTVDILDENLRHILEALPHGKKRHFAALVDVHPNTIPKWLKGTHSPSPTHQAAIARALALPADADIATDPLFLLPYPITDLTRREHLRRSLDRISPEQLRELYPALHKLMIDFS